MGGATRLLAAMLRAENPVTFTYDDAAKVLSSLGFEPARTKPKGSHRLWRLETNQGGVRNSIYVGLVDQGHGPMKAVYIKKMLAILLQNRLIQSEDYS
jgi:hypothetical protein